MARKTVWTAKVRAEITTDSNAEAILTAALNGLKAGDIKKVTITDVAVLVAECNRCGKSGPAAPMLRHGSEIVCQSCVQLALDKP